MKLFDQLRGLSSMPTGLDWTSTDSGFLQTYYQGGVPQDTERLGADFGSYATIGYQGNGVVFSVLNARLRLFSEATFKYRSLAAKRLFGDLSLGLLEHPWPGGSTSELLGRMIQDADLAGNAYIRRVNPTRLERMRPDWVEIVSVMLEDSTTGDKYREVIGYLYSESGLLSQESKTFYPVEDVAHWSPVPDPLANWRGMSWLTPVVREINADLSMTQYKQQFFDNAATPNMIVKYLGKIAPDALKKVQEQIQARHGGTANAFKSMVIDQGADVTVVGNNFAEMAFTLLQAAGEVRIASAGGTPPIVAGLQGGLDASTMANYAAAYRNFADSTVNGLWRGACSVLSKFADPPEGAELWFDLRDIPALRDAEELRQKGYAQFSIAVMNLVNAGYDPATVVDALEGGDMALLKHTGLISVQLLKPNTQLNAPAGANVPDPGGDASQ